MGILGHRRRTSKWCLLFGDLISFEKGGTRKRQSEEKKKKMIYRKWSLLTGPATIVGGIVATVAVANLIFVKNDPFVKPDQKFENQPATK